MHIIFLSFRKDLSRKKKKPDEDPIYHPSGPVPYVGPVYNNNISPHQSMRVPQPQPYPAPEPPQMPGTHYIPGPQPYDNFQPPNFRAALQGPPSNYGSNYGTYTWKNTS